MSKRRLIQLLREIRLEAELTQSQLAHKLGESQSFVSKYESGEQRLDLLQIEQICEITRVPLRKFIERYLIQ